MNKRIALPVLLALMVLVSIASAQIDDRARALLEGLFVAPEASILTLDQVMVMEVEGMEVRTRTVLDYANERARIETEAMPGMTMVILFVDGKVSMMMGGMTMPAMPGIADAYEDIFAADPNDPFAGLERATYDGVQSYGGLVSGEQVTIWGTTAVAGLDGGEEAKLIFNPAGELLGIVSDTEEGTILMLFDRPVSGSVALGHDAVIYLQRGGSFQPFSRFRFEDVRINQPLDPALFGR
jgi:hypothetical protein